MISAYYISATKECAISEEDLKDKPFFPQAIKTFLLWIDDIVKRAKRRNGYEFFPGLEPLFYNYT